MKATTTHLFSAALLVGAIVLLASVLVIKPFDVAIGASYPLAPSFQVATTSTAVSVVGTSVRIAATSSNPLATPGVGSFTRAYATICNPSTTLVYLRMDGDKPVITGQGLVVIAAAAGYSACYELTDDRMTYQGSIQASSTSGTPVSVSVTEYTY